MWTAQQFTVWRFPELLRRNPKPENLTQRPISDFKFQISDWRYLVNSGRLRI